MMNASNDESPGLSTVLIADDQPDLRAALRDGLEHHSRYEVVADVPDADSCLRILGAQAPDVVVLDVNMPGGGPDMVRQVKEIAPGTYILVYSGRQEPAVRRAMLEAGADAFLVKTGRLQPLLDALDQARRR